MRVCAGCDTLCDETDPETYHEVTSWVSGPKLDGPKLREQTGRVMHKKCVDNLVHGQAPDQPELFDCMFHDEGIPDAPCNCSDSKGRTGTHEIVTGEVLEEG